MLLNYLNDCVPAGEFMLARYREVVETVLRFRESKERLIRRAVISLLPRLSAFAPERFAATYLKQCTNYLLSVLKFPSERGVGAAQIPCIFGTCMSEPPVCFTHPDPDNYQQAGRGCQHVVIVYALFMRWPMDELGMSHWPVYSQGAIVPLHEVPELETRLSHGLGLDQC